MEESNEKRIQYRKQVVDFLTRRHIKETLATLVWLRVQKMQGLDIKEKAAETARMEVGVLDEMIAETEEGGQ
jgi:hypothetical protein